MSNKHSRVTNYYSQYFPQHRVLATPTLVTKFSNVWTPLIALGSTSYHYWKLLRFSWKLQRFSGMLRLLLDVFLYVRRIQPIKPKIKCCKKRSAEMPVLRKKAYRKQFFLSFHFFRIIYFHACIDGQKTIFFISFVSLQCELLEVSSVFCDFSDLMSFLVYKALVEVTRVLQVCFHYSNLDSFLL